ncbi:hypothetical protein HDU99_005487 [Rhizoclosmatium hyalinum]|nr:hypothetical protein HDU99_005487 [Rhizoclosmatium hyalinum]
MADAFEQNSFTFRTVHNVLRRANEVLEAKCDAKNITSKKQLKAYLGYFACYVDFLRQHHLKEDKYYFPALVKYGINVNGIADDHHQMEHLIAELDSIAATVKDKKALNSLDPTTFDFPRMKEKLLEIRAELNPHFLKEETEYSPQILRDSGLPAQKLDQAHKDIAVESQKEGSLSTSLPFLIKNLNHQEMIQFAQEMFPVFVLKVVIPVLALKHHSFWQFTYAQQVKDDFKCVKFSRQLFNSNSLKLTNMGNAASIPVIGEIVTVAEAAGKTAAAGACAMVGQSEAADKLIKGAENSFVNYAEVNAVAANIRLGVEAARGNHSEVERLRRRQEEAWDGVGSSLPVVGHVKGVVHYAMGDTAKGDAAMKAASRSAVVLAATVATGGAGALVCGAAAVGTGVAMDGITTGIDSAVHKEYRPAGIIEASTRAHETGDPNDIFAAVAIPVGDFASGAMYGKTAAAKGAKKLANTPAEQIRMRADSTASVLESYKKLSVAPGMENAVQASFAETSPFIQQAPNPSSFLKNLQPGTYDFVRLSDGSINFIPEGGFINPQGISAGHTSLVPPNIAPVMAGQVKLTTSRIVEFVSNGSGHYRAPLEIAIKQVGRNFPRTLIQPYQKVGFGALFDKATGLQNFVANSINSTVAQVVVVTLLSSLNSNGKSCCFKSHHGLYLSASPEGVLTADKSWKREWELFHLKLDGQNRVTIQSRHFKKFIGVTADGTVHVNSSAAGGDHKFHVGVMANGKVIFKTQHGTLLSAKPEGGMFVTNNEDAWEMFTIESV